MKRFYTVMFIASVVVLAAAITALAVWGLNLGVDFTGGTIMEIGYAQNPPSAADVDAVVGAQQGVVEHTTTSTDTGTSIIRTNTLSAESTAALQASLAKAFADSQPTNLALNSVGPTIGAELADQSVTAVIVLLALVLIYIAWMFRTLSRSLSLWAMTAGTVLGLAHDILIPLGVFAALGYFLDVQVTAIFVAAILTILGYTVSDKVVIYDRVRENLLRERGGSSLPVVVHSSVMQTLVRSINNTLTVMLSSLAIFLFGGASIKYFALALMLGVGLGAYSSIFVAAPVLVWLSRKRR